MEMELRGILECSMFGRKWYLNELGGEKWNVYGIVQLPRASPK